MDYHLYISPITKPAPYIGHCFTWKWVQWNSVDPACGNGGPACVQPAPTPSPCEHTWKAFTCHLLGVLRGQEWASFHYFIPLESQNHSGSFPSAFSSAELRTFWNSVWISPQISVIFRAIDVKCSNPFETKGFEELLGQLMDFSLPLFCWRGSSAPQPGCSWCPWLTVMQ